MNFKFHFLGSLAVASTVPIISHYLGHTMSVMEIAVVCPSIIAGGLYPDVDCASIPSRIYAIAGLSISILLYFAGLTSFIFLLWVPFVAAKMSRHRGFTHSIWLPVGLVILPFIIHKITNLIPYDLSYISNMVRSLKVVFIAFSVGLLCHLVLDTRWFKKIAIKMGWSESKKS